MVKSFILQWPYFVVGAVLALGICDRAVGNNIIVAVNRRPSVDIRYTCNDTDDHAHCHNWCPDNTTYLVAGKQCVNNSDLFNGKLLKDMYGVIIIYRFLECSFAITPTGEPHQLSLIIKTVNGTSRLQTINGSSALNATVITRSTGGQVDQSIYHISSLEVYRGRKQAIEISYDGFSLSDSGTIEVYNIIYNCSIIIAIDYCMPL